ncbi:MAG: biotin--[acetyl-CoA-carboxylase] ligase [Henriciella sp.]|nr:biotin--[acetyl-CoA-carboxylase] ligase [Henriciella sp.]
MTSGAPVFWYDEIDSTNEEAKRRAKAGENGPLWLAARQQVSGRGRLGRSWASPVGNLYTTCLFVEPGGLALAGRVPFAAALAIVDLCKSVLPDVPFALKWPNDVRVNGDKICGILIETGESHGVVWVAAGMGLNVAETPEAAGQAATSLSALGASPGLTPDVLMQDLPRLFANRARQMREDFRGLLEDWKVHAEGLGKTVVAGPVAARIEGVFEDLAEDGGLILRLPDGQTQTIRAGDVELVRKVT